MNAERLLAHYEKIADAPDAIARLRRFILDLAVRGKLVPQDPNDEPASDLLKRIGREKARLVKAGEIRKPKAIPALAETPFPIPSNWRWSQLAEIGVLNPRNEAPDTLEASFVPMPLIAAEYGVANQHEVRSWGEIKKGYTHFAEGDVGFAKITPCFENGKSAVFRNLTGGIGAGTTELHIVRPLFVDQDFILLFLKSPHFIETGIPKMTGTAGQKRVPTEYFAHSPFPLPPLAEQHRIVAKVDELMGLCDRLEAARAGREAVRDRLAAASLARLNAPDPETFQSDARFALDALPALTTRPDQIKRLRHTILNLAVRGKLVAQDPKDEPASELLVRLRASGKKPRRAERRPDDTGMPTAGAPFDCPNGWVWTKVQNVLDGNREISYGVIKLGDEPRSGGVPTLRCSDVRPGYIDLSSVRKVQEAIEAEYARTRLVGGEIVINIRGTLGGVALVSKYLSGFNVAREVAVVPIAQGIPGQFMVYLMLSPFFWDHIQSNLRGIAYKGLNLGILRDLPIPLPPLAEQHRIVAKVDALMAMCDQLEASLTATAASSRRLLDALLVEALAPVHVAQLEAAE